MNYNWKFKESNSEVEDWFRERARRVQGKQLARINRNDTGGIIGNADVAPLYDESTDAGKALMDAARAAISRDALRLSVAGARDVRDWKQRGELLTVFAVILALFTLGFYTGIGIYLHATRPSASIEVIAAAAERAIFVQPLIDAHRAEVCVCQ